MNNVPYFHIKNLYFFYGKKSCALNNINTVFEKNKVTALIGASGSGKSTLLRVLNRIYDLYPKQFAKGKVLLNGENILDKNINVESLRKEIGMVFQKPTPFPMSIFDNIAFALKIHHKKMSYVELYNKVENALTQAALWNEVKDKLKKSGFSLSGGQQQRLCIARTLAIEPKILLLDEPTSALDPISTQKIESLIHTLKHKYTIIMVTHNMRQAKRVADKTIFLDKGRIIEEGETKSFFNNPKNELTKNYISTE